MFVHPIVRITRFMIIKHGGHIFAEIHEVCKGLWVDCAFGMLIGWAGELQSHGT